MKKMLLIFIIIMLMVSGCSKESNVEKTNNNINSENETITEEEQENNNAVEEIEVPEKKEVQTVSIQEFDNLLLTQPLAVLKTKYGVQDEEYKSLYPDMLQAVIKNNTSKDIKDVVIGFVAWDKNNLPLKIKGNVDFGDGEYLKLVNYSDINLIEGETFGENSGFSIDEHLEVENFKAIVVSYETFEGETWDNPYFDDFSQFFEGKKLNNEATIDVTIIEEVQKDMTKTEDENENKNESKNIEELETTLLTQPLAVLKTKYGVQDEEYKSLYPDMLQAVIKNNTSKDIKDAVIGFVAWDKNNLPLKIKGNVDFGDGEYLKLVNYSDINLIGGETFGENSGFSIDEHLEVENFKAIAVSYETFEGETWDNPYFDDFSELYEGKKLVE